MADWRNGLEDHWLDDCLGAIGDLAASHAHFDQDDVYAIAGPPCCARHAVAPFLEAMELGLIKPVWESKLPPKVSHDQGKLF